MKRKLLWLFAMVTLFQRGVAQDTLTLKLQEALDATIKNNREILLAKLNEESSIARFKQTNAVFLPQVNLSYTAMISNNPLNSFGFKLQQQSVTPSDFNPQLLNHPSDVQNYATKAEVNQPLVNVDMLYQRRAASEQINSSAYQTKRTKEFLLFEVRKAYAQLQLSYEAVTVLKETLHTITAIHETAKKYYEKGLLQRSDVLQVQVQLATIESKLAEAQSNIGNASDYISMLMGIDSRPVYRVEPLLKSNGVEQQATKIPEDRADFKAMKSALRAQEMMINSGKMAYLPKLNAFANYLLNDKSAFGFGSNSYLVGAQFSWSVFNGTSLHHRISEQKITHARIEQQFNYQKEQSQLELNKTWRQFHDNQYALQQYEVAVNKAAEALRIMEDRFEQGLVSTNDLLQSQTSFSEQKLHQLEAIFTYQTTYAYLQFLTTTEK